MQNQRNGFIPMAVIAVIAVGIVAGGGFLIYRQTHKQQTEATNIQLPAVENSNDANMVGNTQSIQTDPNLEPGTIVSDNLPESGQNCPAVAAPGPDFCPGGEAMAKIVEGCVVGYECQKTSEASLKCDSGCKQQGYDSGKCIQKNAGTMRAGEGAYTEPFKGVASDCVASQGECMCKIVADNSCAIDSDCIDSGCGECVNNTWAAANANVCLQAADTRKICVCGTGKCLAKATCGDGKCESAYETKINCPRDCGQATANKSCNTNADCIDDGTTCHVCVNAVWLKQNPEWSIKYACLGIGKALCECQNNQCVETGAEETD